MYPRVYIYISNYRYIYRSIDICIVGAQVWWFPGRVDHNWVKLAWSPGMERFGLVYEFFEAAEVWDLWGFLFLPIGFFLLSLSCISVFIFSLFRYFASDQIASFHVTSYRLSSARLSSGQLTSPHLISSHLTSPQLTSVRLSSVHLTSAHFASDQIASLHLSSHHLSSLYLRLKQEGDTSLGYGSYLSSIFMSISIRGLFQSLSLIHI